MANIPISEGDTRLNAARKKKGLELQDLAELLGVSNTTAGRYCNPRSHPNFREPRNEDVRAIIRKEFGLTVEEIAEPYQAPTTEKPKQQRRKRREKA